MTTIQYSATPRPIEDLEASQELRSRASGKLGRLPPEMMATHVLAVTAGADWPVHRAALPAHLRRRTDAPWSARTSRKTTRLDPFRPGRAVGARIAVKPLPRAAVAIVCGRLKPGGPA